MDELQIIKYMTWFVMAILGLFSTWIFFHLKNNRDDKQVMWDKIDENQKKHSENHSDLKEDVLKNYVTHERMTQHVDTKLDAITTEVRDLKEDNKRLDGKIDRVLDKLSA